ncbi:hypothetical protein CLV59_101495 [Chitinophaga dinghuensis]|uniref:Uncharacterized protein n=1 Tax=Chitinophaga dinghuensis TaxID=1539050 RepID=A0A327WIY2_9BACT|nr:hypothetical protein [Chitinophaga dinghuensis]RAJ87734.1 hypothetical protein CLV59_101495 [Chitinophaga dinghuensis]
MTTEASITITKHEGSIAFISVRMPIWTKWNAFGNLSVIIPLLGFETFAKDEKDAEHAIEEAIISFCVVAERFGQGITKELQALGWRIAGEDNLEYGFDYTDAVLENIFKMGKHYENPHLKLELAA